MMVAPFPDEFQWYKLLTQSDGDIMRYQEQYMKPTPQVSPPVADVGTAYSTVN